MLAPCSSVTHTIFYGPKKAMKHTHTHIQFLYMISEAQSYTTSSESLYLSQI
jgi:hypothetical protein